MRRSIGPEGANICARARRTRRIRDSDWRAVEIRRREGRKSRQGRTGCGIDAGFVEWGGEQRLGRASDPAANRSAWGWEEEEEKSESEAGGRDPSPRGAELSGREGTNSRLGIAECAGAGKEGRRARRRPDDGQWFVVAFPGCPRTSCIRWIITLSPGPIETEIVR